MKTVDIYSGFDGTVGMILCTAGSRDVLLNGKLYHISRGMVCISSPIIFVYELSRDSDYAEVRIFDSVNVFYSAFRMFADTVFKMRIYNHPCMLFDEEHISYFLEKQRLIETKRNSIAHLQNDEERRLVQHLIHIIEQEVVLEVFLFSYRNNGVQPEEVNPNRAKVFQFIFLLNRHFRTERTVRFYANKVNLSLSHFTRIVKGITGRTPSQWISFITIINAKQMLSQTDESIKEIAAKLHFPEQFTFRKFFKLHVGMPPKEYRMRHGENHGDGTKKTGRTPAKKM